MTIATATISILLLRLDLGPWFEVSLPPTICAKCGKSLVSHGAHAPVTRHLKPPYRLFMAETGFPHSEAQRMKSSENALNDSVPKSVVISPIICPDLESGTVALDFLRSRSLIG